MSKTINICYIDDNIDRMLDRYLDEFCNKSNDENTYKYQINFSDYTFKPEDTYKTLIENSEVNSANIIIIDSRLFENESFSLNKFTGEQFKIILRQILPFIKTIVISQNSGDDDSLTLQKFFSKGDYKEHYDKELFPILDRYILSTIEEFEVLNQLTKDTQFDGVLIGTIQASIDGIRDTALFQKEDLDKIITLFNEVKVKYGD